MYAGGTGQLRRPWGAARRARTAAQRVGIDAQSRATCERDNRCFISRRTASCLNSS